VLDGVAESLLRNLGIFLARLQPVEGLAQFQHGGGARQRFGFQPIGAAQGHGHGAVQGIILGLLAGGAIEVLAFCATLREIDKFGRVIPHQEVADFDALLNDAASAIAVADVLQLHLGHAPVHRHKIIRTNPVAYGSAVDRDFFIGTLDVLQRAVTLPDALP
jgi:hypothetical protein